MMDVSGNFHGEDFNKQDFLDFITPGLTEQNISSGDYGNKQLKSLGLFYESFETLNDRKEIKAKSDNNNAKENTVSCENEKETNNNHLLMSGDTNINYSSYWSNKDEMMKWDTTMLVDDISNWNHSIGEVQSANPENNTDGSIYTLTVLNSHASNSLTSDTTSKSISSWYRESQENTQLMNSQSNEKDESQTLNVGENNDMLVIESLLNIIPNTSNTPQQINVPTSDSNVNSKDNKNNSSTCASYDQMKLSKNSNSHDETQAIMDESEYYIRNTSSSSNVNKIILELNLDKNNEDQSKKSSPNNKTLPEKSEWMDLSESNISPAMINSSLLRNALQGKSLLRYNGGPEKGEKSNEYTVKQMHSSMNSRNNNNNNNNNSLSQFNIDENRVVKIEENQIETLSPTTSEHRTILLYNSNQTSHEEVRICDRINILDGGSESTNMDDIFLSHLDNAVAFPEDYEKLKSIENEVAESVGLNTTYYFNNANNNDQVSSSPNYLHPSLLPTNSILNPLYHHSEVPTLEIPSTTSSMINNYHTPNATNLQKSRKYKRTSSSSSSGNTGASSTKSSNLAGTSSGLRKERSLHYCNICNKGFKDKYSVNVHIRTHTGEKPFSCTLCGKSFRQKAHLAKHYHTHLTGQSKTSNNSSSSTNNNSKNR